MKTCDVDPKLGIICPWCAGDKTPIAKCPHDPFKLMQQVDYWKSRAEKGDEALTHLEALKGLLT